MIKYKRGTLFYRRWQRIKSRCTNKNCHDYKYYGGRGITICIEWANDVKAFAEYMGKPPGSNFEVGRINNDLGYQPGNVCWVTRTENMRNTQRTHWVVVDGRKVSLKEACAAANVTYYRTHKRLCRGLSIEDALQCMDLR